MKRNRPPVTRLYDDLRSFWPKEKYPVVRNINLETPCIENSMKEFCMYVD